MAGHRRLTKPTLGIVIATGSALVIPAGQIIEISADPDEGNRTIDVIWDGKKLMMFVNDLRDRSHEISP